MQILSQNPKIKALLSKAFILGFLKFAGLTRTSVKYLQELAIYRVWMKVFRYG